MGLGTRTSARWSPLGVAVLAVLVALGVPAAADPPPAAPADLDEVAAALRVLVDDPAWLVDEDPRLEGPDLASLGFADERPEWRAALAEWREGRSVTARLSPEGERVVAFVNRFGTPEAAVTALRLLREQIGASDREIRTRHGAAVESAFEEGAGPGGSLPGFRNRKTLGLGGDRTVMDLQAFARGPVLVLLIVFGVPAVDRESQDRVLAYADLFLTDPAAARKAPRPATPKVEARGTRLRVRVLGPDGVPIPRAEAGIALDDLPWKARVRDGVVDFRRFGEGPVRVFVWGARGEDGEPLPLAPADRSDVGPDETEVTLRLEPGVAIAGRVVDARGSGVPGVRLDAEPDESMHIDVPLAVLRVVHGWARTAPDGSFRIVGLRPIRYSLHVLRPGEAKSSLSVEADGGDGDRRVVLSDVRDVRVTVLDPSDRPVAGASVWASATSGSGGHAFRGADTGADGGVTLEGLEVARPYDLRIQAPSDRRDLAHLEHGVWPQEPTTLRLPRGWTLRGRVVDASGKGVAAAVRLDGAPFAEITQTEEDGTFEMHHLPWGPVRVTARDRDHPFREDDDSWVDAEPDGPEVVLTTGAALRRRRVEVRVVDPEGRPIPRAWARVSDGVETDERVEVRGGSLAATEPIEVEGPYAVEVWGAASEDGTCLGLGPALFDQLDPEEEDPELPLSPGRVASGTVRAHDGTPVPGVHLEAVPADDARWIHLLGTERVRHAWTDTAADGSFRLAGLGGVPYAVRITAPPPHADPEHLPVQGPQEDLVIRLPRGVRLLVRDWRGEPVAGARVSLDRPRPGRRGSDSVSARETDAKGEVWVRSGLPRHELDLSVSPPRDREDCLPYEVEGWWPGHRRFRLGRAFTVRGVVRGPDGPAWAARIQRAPDVEGGEPTSLSMTDMSGRFEARGVPYGPVRVRAVDTGGPGEPERASPWVEVTPESGPVELRIPADR